MSQSNLKEELLEMFHRSAHLLHRSGPHLRRQGRRPPLPPAQARLMRLLAGAGPVTQRELSEWLDIRSASLSELLGKMERSSWIRRRPNETDKRTIDIDLTEEGENMLQNAGNERMEMAEEMFGNLTEEELRQLHGLLGKLIGDWETRFESEGPHSRGGRGHGEGRPEHGPGWLRRVRGCFEHHGPHGPHDPHHPHHVSPDHPRHRGGEGLGEDRPGRRSHGRHCRPDDRGSFDPSRRQAGAADFEGAGDGPEGRCGRAEKSSRPDPDHSDGDD